jgi:ATP-dependent helicase/nuclease subunit B
VANLLKLGVAGTAEGLSFIDELGHQIRADFTLDISGYSGLFAEIAGASDVPGFESPHPRLFFLSPLQSRLLSADVAVLAGLNEGCWPRSPEPDPWLNKQDRTFVGLPAPERRIGQAAHDFVSLAVGAKQAYLTRSRKMNGSLARPSRWISRIQALAAGAGASSAFEPEKPWLDWAQKRHEPAAITPIARPEPRPPLAARPQRLSVTAIETWLANPYAIYARHILGLDPLRRLDERSDARDKGILVHAALNRFFDAHRQKTPPDTAAKLLDELDKAAETLGFNLENAPFWRPRFARFAEWFAETEEARRADLLVLKSEVGGKLRLDTTAGAFEITARADRIDLLNDGSVRIYDFKTSANTANVSVRRGAPQLALEGLLAREGAFAGIPAGTRADLAYIVAAGGEPPGEIVSLKQPAGDVIQAAHTGTLSQIARFNDQETPYSYETRAIYKEKAENDPYAHLARVQEWALGSSAEENGDD